MRRFFSKDDLLMVLKAFLASTKSIPELNKSLLLPTECLHTAGHKHPEHRDQTDSLYI